MNELLALISAAVTYAIESPQNFVVVCGFVGWVGMFVQPMQKQAYIKPAPRKGRKQKRAGKKSLQVQKTPKQAKAKKKGAAKPRYTAPEPTPQQRVWYEDYLRRTRRTKGFENIIGGQVPL